MHHSGAVTCADSATCFFSATHWSLNKATHTGGINNYYWKNDKMLMLFGAGGAVIFACLALWNKEPLYHADVLSPPMRIRMCFEITGRLFYVLAVAITPLSSATAILQATPIVVVAGAAVFFGERVGWMRWAAIVVGLIGVMIVLRPGTDAFSPLSILAVIGI